MRVDGRSVKVNVPYVMIATPQIKPPTPGRPALIGHQQLEMKMAPGELQAYDDETGEWIPVPIVEQPKIYTPTGKKGEA